MYGMVNSKKRVKPVKLYCASCFISDLKKKKTVEKEKNNKTKTG